MPPTTLPASPAPTPTVGKGPLRNGANHSAPVRYAARRGVTRGPAIITRWISAGTADRGMANSTAKLPGRDDPVPRGWWRARRRRLLTLWGAGLVASLLVTGASSLGYLERLQARTLDLLQRLGGQRLPSEVVVVAIDDDAFASLGERQPIPRAYLARLISGLQRAGAAVVGLDINLRVATTPASDAALAQAILEFSRDGASQVVMVDGRPPDSGPLADPAFLRAVTRASDRVPVDDDGVIRRVSLLIPERGPSQVPAFSLAVLARLASQPVGNLVQAAVRSPDGRVSLPVWQSTEAWDFQGPAVALRPGELWRVNFVGPEKSILTIPSNVVESLGAPGADVALDNPIRGRIVLLGATFRDSRDFFQTPFGRLPGVEIHANFVHMLATRRPIRPAGWLISFAIQAAIVLIGGVILVIVRPLPGSLLAIAVTLLVAVPGSYFAFHSSGYAVDLLLPVLVTCALGVTAHALARRRFRDSFGRYVGRDVMAQVLAENPALSGDRRQVSILVSDLRGFTTLSEKLSVEAVAAQLNEYFPAMVDAIFAQRGTVDDFIGDGILAVFGAPISAPDHARRAVQAAVAMQEALVRLNRGWEARGLPTLQMGIGIHSGVVFAGNVGSPERVKYTVIGDAVNVTARLEGLNKELGTSILLTEETRNTLGDLVGALDRGEIPVKGRAEPLRVYELAGLQAGGGPARENVDEGHAVESRAMLVSGGDRDRAPAGSGLGVRAGGGPHRLPDCHGGNPGEARR
jgi:adenylate cyclase